MNKQQKLSVKFNQSDYLPVLKHTIVPTSGNLRLTWDGHADFAGYRGQKYLPFSEISDLIDQFNYVGFHDVCNYPTRNELTPYKDPKDPRTKGVKQVFVGYTKSNSTGTKQIQNADL